MAELFDTSPQNITLHIKSLYNDGEISESATCKEYLQVRHEGNGAVRRGVKHYNLDSILAVVFRVRSPRGTQFRQWATTQLRDYLTQGFIMDDERMKNPDQSVYLERVLERIREIRASERRFYQKITDIYATAVDYDAKAPINREFFATFQNKLHWAIAGKTASEQIYASADAEKLHMGLTTLKNAPQGKILKSDITVPKNYLSARHIEELNRIIGNPPRGKSYMRQNKVANE